MSKMPQIVLNKLCFEIVNTSVQFDELSISFSAVKAGLIGENGVGKTTLLRLIAGELAPMSGSVLCSDSVLYVPQQCAANAEELVVDVLGLKEKLCALEKIAEGSADPKYFDIVGDDWNIEHDVKKYFHDLDVSHTLLFAPFDHLSGGQKTKILLIKAFLSNADFILFDEPTNNLDAATRQCLYQFIQSTKQGVIVVSHDRELLNLMDVIVELTTKGLSSHTGNYAHFVEQKNIEQQAIHGQLEHAKKTIKNVSKSIQKNREKYEQKKSKGVKAARSGSMDKQTALSKKGRSEKTASRQSTMEERLITKAKDVLENAKEKVIFSHEIDIDLSATHVSNGKRVVDIENLSFSYPGMTSPVIDHLNLSIIGPERVAIVGSNGSGKTTLVKLICSKLQPTSGMVDVGVDQVSYLDQRVSILDVNKTLLENFQLVNPDVTVEQAYRALASFKFRNKEAEKMAVNLSGGEKIRAGLACALMSKPPPQLIILDEPTNHLDIKSISCIEEAIRCFQGAVIVISHDKIFLENIGVEKTIGLS